MRLQLLQLRNGLRLPSVAHEHVKTGSVKEEVRLCHRIMVPCDIDSLINLVAHHNYHSLNIPSSIPLNKFENISHQFDCPDLPAGNLQQRHSTFSPSTATEIGAEFEVDFMGRWTGPDSRPASTVGKHL